MQPKINADVENDQIKIKLTSNDQLKALGGYIKYDFNWWENNTFENEFDTKKDSEEFTHTFDQSKITGGKFENWMKSELPKKEVEIKLKKKVMMYRKTLDTQMVKLSQFTSKSVIQKQVNLEGASVDVEITIRKSLRQAETEQVKVPKLKIRYIPAPFRTLEE